MGAIVTAEQLTPALFETRRPKTGLKRKSCQGRVVKQRRSLLAGTTFYPDAAVPEGFVLAARREVAGRYAEVCLDKDEECPVFALRVMCFEASATAEGEKVAGRNVGEVLVARLNGDRGYANSALATEVDEGYRRKGLATAMYDLAEILWGTELEQYPGGSSTDADAFWAARTRKKALALV